MITKILKYNIDKCTDRTINILTYIKFSSYLQHFLIKEKLLCQHSVLIESITVSFIKEYIHNRVCLCVIYGVVCTV